MQLAWIDLVGMGLVAFCLFLGFWRGLWWQVIRLVGLFAAVLVARAASPQVATRIGEQWPDLTPRLTHGLAWFGIFLLGLLAATLLGILGRKLLEAMQLGLADRLGGAAAGAVTGAGIHVALLVAVCQLGSEAFVSRTIGGTTSERVVEAVGTRWPVVLGKEAGAEVDQLLDRARIQAQEAEAADPPKGIVR